MFETEDVLNGDKLEELFFPTAEKKYDFFISYSHNDEEIVKNLANFLLKKDFKVFLDSKIWGSADHLLKLIDDKYCRNNNGSYDYNKRNFSTSHVHSLLNSAIGEAIHKSDKIIFTSIKNSFDSDSKNLETKILSPWIYQELNYFNLFYNNQNLFNKYLLENKRGTENITQDNLQVWRKGDISNLTNISINQLKLLK